MAYASSLLPLPGLLLASLVGCQQSAPTAEPVAAPSRKSFRLAGTWVQHARGTFTLVEIGADSGGTYTSFMDYRKELPDSWKPGDRRYFLYKSPIRVECPQPGRVELHTRQFRFDYDEDGDTLREFDKMGPQGTLIRLPPARY